MKILYPTTDARGGPETVITEAAVDTPTVMLAVVTVMFGAGIPRRIGRPRVVEAYAQYGVDPDWIDQARRQPAAASTWKKGTGSDCFALLWTASVTFTVLTSPVYQRIYTIPLIERAAGVLRFMTANRLPADSDADVDWSTSFANLYVKALKACEGDASKADEIVALLERSGLFFPVDGVYYRIADDSDPEELWSRIQAGVSHQAGA
jgi:hypothetical protein